MCRLIHVLPESMHEGANDMIAPNCPQCGGPMRIKVARRGPNPGSEFSGCNAFRAKGCRGTLEVPRQEWDWFGLVPTPVSIIRNAQNSHNRDVDESLDYGHDAYGMFGNYSDYDDDMTYFEWAMEADNRRWEAIENAEIDQILGVTGSGYSLARRIIETANRFGFFGQAREALAYAITEKFAGSSPSRLVSLATGCPDIEAGLIYLDDESRLQFNKGASAIAMFDTGDPVRSAVLSDDQFKYIADYFAQNFGAHTPASINYL